MARVSRRPIGLSNLRGFDAAARHLSFTHAAAELNLSQSSISRQVQNLESELGKPLFARGTRELTLTTAGQKFHRVVRAMLAEVDRSVAEIRGTAQRKRVALTTWPSFASLWLVPRLSAFARQYPDIDIRIDAGDTIVDLESEELDVAIRYCRDDQAPRHATLLMEELLTPALSPGLLERIGPLQAPFDISKGTLLTLDDGSQSSVENSWENWLEDAGVKDLQPGGQLLFNFVDQLMQAAARGQGIVLAKSVFLRDFIERGELVAPFAHQLASRYRVYLVPSQREDPPEHVKAFIDWLVVQSAPSR
ncbi:glycine cleavage system transcriptional regulator GcvA [soil metagenome]